MKAFLTDLGIQVGAVLVLAIVLVIFVLAARKFVPTSSFF